MESKSPTVAVELAMVAIRRRQNRRSIAKAAGSTAENTALSDVIDVIDSAQGRCSVATIAERLSVDQPRASKLVARAVADGLVRRESDQADGRRSLLALTEAGQEAVEAMHKFRRSLFGQAMADWSAGERMEFARLLSDFVARMQELSP
ncbi:MarR family winged helix-turn-helix transcriptional regulator [Fodinicola feengrottensis]|uniref:MarR family winged helix-turn-helix transcriptional regulator n=1 Tax=Fodinicola feengrottensis TaxID=435914 RepID=A0ABN2GSD3_9ACTN|nr:MarR family transcriptional regulator [Fodinicola feengrottensis]